MNVFTFWEYTNSCLEGWGNAFVIIRRDMKGDPVELIPVHPRLVSVVFRNARKWYIVAGSLFFDGTYPGEDMLLFRDVRRWNYRRKSHCLQRCGY